MGYAVARFDMSGNNGHSNFQALALQNLGLSIRVLEPGEGFDFFHNHREQEEVYFCLSGQGRLLLRTESDEVETLDFEAGAVVRVDASTLRALGNPGQQRAMILIAGACPHTFPAGIGGHAHIADVFQVLGHGETGFRAIEAAADPVGADLEDC